MPIHTTVVWWNPQLELWIAECMCRKFNEAFDSEDRANRAARNHYALHDQRDVYGGTAYGLAGL